MAQTIVAVNCLETMRNATSELLLEIERFEKLSNLPKGSAKIVSVQFVVNGHNEYSAAAILEYTPELGG